jgi:hypothetical protein
MRAARFPHKPVPEVTPRHRFENALLTAYWTVSGYGVACAPSAHRAAVALAVATVLFATVGFGRSQQTVYLPVRSTIANQPVAVQADHGAGRQAAISGGGLRQRAKRDAAARARPVPLGHPMNETVCLNLMENNRSEIGSQTAIWRFSNLASVHHASPCPTA